MRRVLLSVLLLCSGWLLSAARLHRISTMRISAFAQATYLASHLTQHLARPQIAAETAQLNAEIERLGGTPLQPAAGGAATPVDLPVDLPTARGRRKSKGRKRG